MAELLIIADDLTGAIETGVQLTKQGISSKVILHSNINFQSLFSQIVCSVLIVNTESRHILAKEAAERVNNVVKEARTAGIKNFYKKTDSTMRGNIGAELEAFLQASTQQTLPFIPAHPKLRRFTRKGFHYVGEQFLHETRFGKDLLNPIAQSNISEILHLQTGININAVDATRDDHEPIADGILAFDCRSTDDLITIADFLFNHSLHHTIAGSAAMVELLPQLLLLKVQNLQVPKLQGPTLIVNGSLNRISLEQVRYARDQGVKMISIPQELLSDTGFNNNPHFISLLSTIQTCILAGQDIILNTTRIEHPLDGNSSNYEQMNPDHYVFIAKQMGSIVAAILKEVHLGILTIFGGDTMNGIMQALSCKYIEPNIEIIPGVAVSSAIIKNKDIHLVSKPGGYGDDEVIIHILNFIKT